MSGVDGFVDAVLTSPLGVSWLAVLEAQTSGDQGWSSTSRRVDAVAATVDRIGEVTFGAVIDAALLAVLLEAGPWVVDAPAKVADAYRQADRRAPIAEAVAERFGDDLTAPLDRTGQQWWTDGAPWFESLAPLFGRFDDVYGAGEFTTAGLWTATDPPREAIVGMVGAWEFETGPLATWWLPVRPEARVFEIHRPADWARLVAAHPRRAAPHPGWELPGVNQRLAEIAPLLAVAEQRAARETVRRHVVPDWRSVAGEYDGIHVSWAGFITAEGCIVDLGEGDVAMLRYWFSERTLWLADVFGEPREAPDPQINLAGDHHPPLAPRRPVDRPALLRLLGR